MDITKFKVQKFDIPVTRQLIDGSSGDRKNVKDAKEKEEEKEDEEGAEGEK